MSILFLFKNKKQKTDATEKDTPSLKNNTTESKSNMYVALGSSLRCNLHVIKRTHFHFMLMHNFHRNQETDEGTFPSSLEGPCAPPQTTPT